MASGGRQNSRVTFISEIGVGYRHGWFEYLDARDAIDLSVIYLAGSQPDRPWETDGSGAGWAHHARSITFCRGGERGFFPRLSVDLGRRLSQTEPDLVIIPGWAHPVCLQAIWWCRRRSVPYAVMFESWSTQRQTRLPALIPRFVRDRILGGAAFALPVGRRAEQFAEHLHLDRVAVVHANTCDSERIAQATLQTQRSTVPTVTFVGRLMHHKGIDLVLEAALELGAAGVMVQIIGEGPERSTVEDFASAHPNVSFLGPLPPAEVHEAMARSWVVLVPSRAEPWGVVLHEALASGTPVVASDAVGSAGELLEGGDVGAIVAAEGSALARACIELISKSADEIAERCREAALEVSYRVAADELRAMVGAVREREGSL